MDINSARILVCDESDFSRKQIISTVKQIGDPVFIEVTEGDKVLEIYTEEKPDVLFLDLSLSGDDGIDMLKAIMDINPHAHVVAVSEERTQEMLEQVLGIGATEFIRKPFSHFQILNALTKCLC